MMKSVKYLSLLLESIIFILLLERKVKMNIDSIIKHVCIYTITSVP